MFQSSLFNFNQEYQRKQVTKKRNHSNISGNEYNIGGEGDNFFQQHKKKQVQWNDSGLTAQTYREYSDNVIPIEMDETVSPSKHVEEYMNDDSASYASSSTAYSTFSSNTQSLPPHHYGLTSKSNQLFSNFTTSTIQTTPLSTTNTPTSSILPQSFPETPLTTNTS